MDEPTQASPRQEMGQMMEKKVGGKMTIGQYYGFQKKYYMWLIIAAVVVHGLSLIPSLYVVFSFLAWLVYLYAAFVYFWFGYQLAKQKRGELKDALLGGGFLGLGHGLVAGILGSIAQFIFARTLTGGLSALGFGVAAGGFAIGGLIFTIIGAIVGGLVLSLIGFAVAGGFGQQPSKPQPQA